MQYPELKPILKRLIEKYRVISYEEWVRLYEAGNDKHNDYSEDEEDSAFFWQAHTDVLEIDENENGKYAHIAVSVYPEGVHSVPPAPSAGFLTYESGICDVGTPCGEYIFNQNTGLEEHAT